MRERHRSTRPADEPIFTSPTGMDFEKRRLIVPPGIITVISGNLSQTSKTASFTAGDETVILADATNSAIEITLPAAAAKANKVYYIKKVDNSGNSVTIKGDSSSEKIDGEEKAILTLSKQSIMIICSGTTEVVDSYWHIIGGEYVKMEEIVKEGNETQGKILNLLILFKKALKKMSNLDLKED